MRSDDRPTSPGDETLPPDWEALARFLAGESDAAESRAVAAWLEAHPADDALVRSLHGLGADAGADADPMPVDVEAALARVTARRREASGMAHAAPVAGLRLESRGSPRDVGRLHATARVAPIAPRRSRAWMGWSGVGLAAAAALLLFVRGDRGTGDDRAASSRVLATAAGVRDSVRLPDGTRVLLGPSSRLTWDAGDPRLVTLEGMAHFSVVHDAAHPFIVRAGDAVIRDVGTAFVVRTDTGASPRVSVAVSEGAVSLAPRGERDPLAAHDGVTLAAGDRAELVAGSTTVVQRAALAAADTAWASSRLVYAGTPLDRVIGDIARWYGVELRVADRALLARRLTASFDATDPPARVIDAIALTLGASVTREAGGGIAVLHPGPTP